MERRGGRLASVDCRTKNQTKSPYRQHDRCHHHHNHIIATLLKFHPQRGCYCEVRYCIFIMTTIREEMWVKKHFLRPVFYHDFPENMMKTRFQTQSSVVGSARRATTLSSASLRWNARRLDQDDHGDHLHCHQCGVGEVRNMSSPTECQEAPQLHLDYSNPWFVMNHWCIAME